MSFLLFVSLLALTVLGQGVPSSDVACWASHSSWKLVSRSIDNAPEASKTRITNRSFVDTLTGAYTYIVPGPDTTLCDGIPRVTDRRTPTGTYATTVVTITTVSTWYPPEPTCTIQHFGSACRSLWSTYSSMTSTASGYLLAPPCSTPNQYANPTERVLCSLDTGTHRVLYWPTPTVHDLCASGSTTAIPTPTTPPVPPTATYKGLILTYPTVYYIFDKLVMYSSAGSYNNGRHAWVPLPTATPGPTTPITLSQDPAKTPISSADVYCVMGRVCYTTLHPFRFDHLATVPVDKYYSYRQSSSTIYQGYYTPYYTLVPEISASRGWEACDILIGSPILPTYIAIQTS